MSANHTNLETTSYPSPESVLSPLMPPEETLAVMGYKRIASLYALIANPNERFPAPISLGPRRSNGYAGKAMWVRAEVMAWLEAKIAAPRSLGSGAKPLPRLGSDAKASASQPA